jgi:hypothetical protein
VGLGRRSIYEVEACSYYSTSSHITRFSQPLTIETDTLGVGVGAVLSQNGHPIAFFSKKLSMRRQKTVCIYQGIIGNH